MATYKGQKLTDPDKIREVKIRKRIAAMTPDDVTQYRERAWFIYESNDGANLTIWLDSDDEETAINMLTAKLIKQAIEKAVDDPDDDFDYS